MRSRQPRYRRRSVTTIPRAIRLAALAGQGIALVAACGASAAIERGELTCVLADAMPRDRRMPVWLLWPADRHELPKVRVFVDFVAEVFAQRLG